MSHGSKAPPTCQVKPFLQQSGARLNLPLSYQRLERQPLYCRQRLALRLRWPYHRRSSEGPARESRAARTSDTTPSMRSDGLQWVNLLGPADHSPGVLVFPICRSSRAARSISVPSWGLPQTALSQASRPPTHPFSEHGFATRSTRQISGILSARMPTSPTGAAASG